jgi:hypothetical protein
MKPHFTGANDDIKSGFGCAQYLNFLRLTVVDETTAGQQAYNFANLFPTGSPIFDQIESSGNIVTYS